MRAGDWKYLSVEGNEFLYNLATDERERANWAKRAPGRLEAMRARYAEWERSLPTYPDATFSVIGTAADFVTPSG
jgi:hypothetical protein